jgi:hypothetical protein
MEGERWKHIYNWIPFGLKVTTGAKKVEKGNEWRNKLRSKISEGSS